MMRLKLKTLFDGKMIFLSGSPALEKKGGIPTGRLSGIVNHWIPTWLKGNQLPSYETNCIEDWEKKVDRIARETIHEDLRLISGIPPWVQMFYEKLLELSGKKTIREVFPNLQLFVYGGVNFEPYRAQLEQLTGGPIPSIETYPASEGFIAFQDTANVQDGLALQCNSGIYFEFIPMDEINSQVPIRIPLSDVELGKEYAVILSTNAGLWAYNLGDTVMFLSREPFRIKVTGRVKHFISAFGEHVIAKEVEEALRLTMIKHPCAVQEFTVAPQVNPGDAHKPFHEWWIEFGTPPVNLAAFASDLNDAMVNQNLYYRDLMEGKILQPLHVRSLPKGAFKAYMQSIGKLGGQNKVPRLSNDRTIANALETYLQALQNLS
ncbi:MAG TPA: GH3 auxin-responsive promoter family protein, partial [Saprospiraceae bacterium]|nr:GH3 auxin-responsive promoter family protein [Saprospiraceae bacterium]